METLQFPKRFALVRYSVAALEKYNPTVVASSDDIDELQDIDTEGYGVTTGFAIVEKGQDGSIIDAYNGNIF